MRDTTDLDVDAKTTVARAPVRLDLRPAGFGEFGRLANGASWTCQRKRSSTSDDQIDGS